MYTESDPQFMFRALELGRRALFHATPNPRVGCVIVRDSQILGEGYTQPPGGHHAEIEALQDARRRGNDVHGATAYVTLEPCSHFGRTPPCATALIEARIGRVVAAVEDPNPLVAGRGMDMLRGAGVDARCGLLRTEAIEANNGFFSRMNRGRPWVRVKLAASLDGRTALENGRSRWITGEAARADGHAWRARSCAVLTGIGTLRSDDPLLTVREVATPRQPLKVLADSRFAIDENARWIDGNAAIVFTAREDPAKSARLIDRHVQAVGCAGADGRVDLAMMLRELAGRGVNELHVEAGSGLSGALVRAGLVDEILLYLAPVLIGPGRGLFELPVLEDLAQARRLRLHETALVGEDLRMLVRAV
jgi:diaminohydroxyphosphoribosylaminopyrimidine deaminase / 5-amino-6-(5-phosphoribosylamino)uracil reductase